MRNLTVLGLLLAANLSSASASDDGYRIAGETAVLDEGRLKPLDSFARLLVKQVYTRESIKLVNADGETTERWEPLPAFLDWQARPEFWNDQEIIAVEHPELRKMILGISAREALETLAKSGKLSEADKARVLKAAEDPTWGDLKAAAALSGVSDEMKARLKLLSHRLHPDQKWLAPSDLEDSTFQVDGKETSFIGWVTTVERAARQKAGRFGRPEFTPIQSKARDVYQRLARYMHYRDGNAMAAEGFELNITPRPLSKAYLDFTTKAYAKAYATRDAGKGIEELTPLELDAWRNLEFYVKDIKSTAIHKPGTNPEFDARFTEWLREKSFWVPFRVLRESKPEELTQAGFDAAKVTATVKAYEALIADEKAHPHELSTAPAQAWVDATRELGESVAIDYLLRGEPQFKLWSDYSAKKVAAFESVRKGVFQSATSPSDKNVSELINAARAVHPAMVAYPSAAEMQRELTYNRFAPFYKAPMAYAAALVLVLFSLGFANAKGSTSQLIQRGLYSLGMLAFVSGIGLEVWGFYYRVRITGWAPVTSMAETVIWVALVTAVLGLVMELIYRKTYAVVAASGMSLLATLLAANVTLLDPEIKALQPVLRSNYWLTIHVLTIVSSYAAFALAMGLGLLGLAYYLSATYKRDVPYGTLAKPLIPSLPMLAIGVGAFVANGSKTMATGPWMALTCLSVAGLLGTVFGVFALIGEASSRASKKTCTLGLVLAVAGVAGAFGARFLTTPAWWPESLSLMAPPAIVAALGLSMIILSMLGASARKVMAQPALKTQVVTTAAVAEEELDYAQVDEAPNFAAASAGGGIATLRKPTAMEIFRMEMARQPKDEDPRTASMQATAARIKPLSNFTYRAMQVGVLLVAAGTILGGVWADVSWGRFWGWDAKEVWALITLLVYLVPLHGRFAGWVNTFTLVCSSIICFASVLMAWYGVNFVLATGLHSYGFSEGGGQGVVATTSLSVVAIVLATAWRRHLASPPVAAKPQLVPSV